MVRFLLPDFRNSSLDVRALLMATALNLRQRQSNPKDQVKTSVMKENYAANLETVTLDDIHFDKACVSIYFKGLIEVSLLNIYVHLVYPPGLVSENTLDISDGDDDFLRTECIIVQTLWIAPV
ncbi:hypothetical protein MG293_018362 [Ovis ammon polii]|uniref:Uncharacterized protein n=1 Tax=Ovis ammon polii TaxID=230172 RepID=A0AAD4TQ19_OVIAM|nr:hypothetical protein MG293_018362 [Ovis ammon polii]